MAFPAARATRSRSLRRMAITFKATSAPTLPMTPRTLRSASSAAMAQKKRLREAELLLDISRKMSAIDSLDTVLNVLVEMTTAELGAERGTLFLNDAETSELYSRVAMGNFQREIRILNTSGVAGYAF